MSRTYAFEDPDLESFRKEVVRKVSGARWLKGVCEKTLGRECETVALVGSVLDPQRFHDSSDVDVAFSLVPQPGEKEELSENLSYQLQMELIKNPIEGSVLNSLVFVGPIKTKRGKTLRIASSSGVFSERSVRTAKAEVPLRRQRTQYSCMSASMCACLNALGHKCDEDEVNAVMGARPMKGAAWEQALACAQHYGVRGTLVCPATVAQLREWVGAGKPVMIAWNPEGRDWSHASVVYDVTDNLPEELPPECSLMGSRGDSGPWVWVADTNIPNPEKTSRVLSADLFYSKWFEKWPNYLVRRPALMLDREITPEGRQVMASAKSSRVASRPGPQWNPWPSSKFSLEKEIDFWKSKLLPVRGTTILQDMYPQAGPKEVLLVKGLIEALENQDRKKAKSFATALEDKIPGVVGNTTWSYVLDGRKASVESVVSRHPTNLEKVSMAPQLNKEVHPNPVKTRDLGVQGLIERGGAGAGKHKNKQDFERGHARYPKHKGRGYDEGMTEPVKTASGGSLASFLRLWWGALEDQLVASAVVIGGDCSVKILSNTLRARISLQDPFNEDRIMLGRDEPHVQVVLSLQDEELGFMKVLILVVNEDRVVKKKEFTPGIMSKGAEELANLIFDAAMDLFENTEF